MILGHTAYFAGLGADTSLATIINFINLTTFTVFLFLSGTGMFLSYLRPDISNEEFAGKKAKIPHKAFKLLLSYYLIVLIGYLPELLDSNVDILSRIIRLILFVDVPNYVEFLLPFIFFYLLIYYLRPLLKNITNSLFLTLVMGIGLYALGMFLYKVDVPNEFLFIKSIFVGHSDWYRFPILQYSIVFLLGAYWGKLIAFKDYAKEVRLKNGLMAFIGLLTLVVLVAANLYPSMGLDIVRWPPSITFILIGLSYTSILLFIIEKLVGNGESKVVSFIGQNLFDYYIVHLVLLFIGQYGLGIKLGEPLAMFGYYIIIVLLGTILVYITNSHKVLNPLRERFSLRTFDSVYFRAFYILAAVWLAGIFMIRLITNYNQDFASVLSFNVVDKSYIERVDANFTIDSFISRKTIFKIESDDPSFDQYKSGIVDITVNNKGYDYRGIDVFVDGKLADRIERNASENYNYKIEPSDYAIGTHRVEVFITGANKKSEPIEFMVSYPLYVVWTIDWEGYDISDSNMSAMSKISSKYKIPMVQLVTPRVFEANDVSEIRKDALKKFVFDRYALGDEIGMHLHMHCDLFKACGLDYKTEPKWDSRYNCHDVLTSAYSPEEFGELLDCSLNFFEEYNFPKPVTYRAGGWFIDLKNLKVLPKYGFKIDTSGRDKYNWGNAVGFWDLAPSQPPYMISNSNQNKASDNDNFGIIEVPNNGRDTTNNPPEVMIGKFNEIYSDKMMPLSKMNVVNFMSHPHWFTTYDNATMNKVMDYVINYSAEAEKGPVIFTTLDRMYGLRNPEP